MKSKVYFVPVHKSDDLQAIKIKVKGLLDESKLLDRIRKDDNVAIKVHFGEKENTGFVRPEYVRVIHDAIANRHATSFVSDTNTLYRGGRTNSDDHFKLAYEHGFTPDVVGAPLVISDDTKEENISRIQINQKFVKVAKIATVFHQAQAIVGVAHFKGHMMTGFGGALKNLGMGCATREGKLEQHCGVAPVVSIRDCLGCEACIKACPAGAISIKNQRAHLDSSKCIGCASCIAACTSGAIDVAWEAGGGTIQEKMVEYAKAVLEGKEDKRVFLNFAIKITKECDCLAKDDPRIAPDVGIFASSDPVSIDRACLDLINQVCGKDIFRKAHPRRDGNVQLEYAAGLGLGNLNYELVRPSL